MDAKQKSHGCKPQLFQLFRIFAESMTTFYSIFDESSQSPAIVQKNWIDQVRFEVYQAIKTLSIPRLKQAMAMLNYMLLWKARESGAIEGVDLKYQYMVNRDRLKDLINGSQSGTIAVQTSMMWLSKTIKEEWHGAAYSENSLRVMRSLLSELNLFKFETVAPGSTYEPPVLEEFDLLRALIVYEMLEEELMQRWKIDDSDEFGIVDRELSDLPKSNGVAIALFNAVFEGVAEYRRVEPFGTLEQQDAPPEPELNEDSGVFVSVKRAIDWKKKFIGFVQAKVSAKLEKYKQWRQEQAAKEAYHGCTGGRWEDIPI